MAADTLDIREGLWESTSSVSIEGLQIPPALLQNLPEQQREQFARLDGRPHVDRACVTQKDIAQGFARFDKESQCVRRMTSSSPRHLAADITCQGLWAGNGTAQVDAPSATRVQGAAALQSALGNVHATFEARWLSASCGALKQ